MTQVPILMYHWFRDGRRPASRSPQLELEPELFERQLRWLSQAGYRSVSLAEALARPRKPRTVVLTFDDGTADFWEHARPALDRHAFRATLFVVTGHVGGESVWDERLGEPPRELLTWEQLETLAREGHEIGSHTHSHRPFIEQDDAAVRRELERSREILRERLGRAAEFVAYPRGLYRPEHKRLVREAGYRGACAVVLRWRDLRRSDDYELKRVTVKGGESLFRFRTRLRLAGLVRHRPAPEPPAAALPRIDV
jgi:peptidoglycan/xylan/chitin deacetylase (PgdA/CDA1 family)